MKKVLFVLLVVTAIMALFSAYSLAAINQVYKIEFDWYSQYNGNFIQEHRDTSMDHWGMEGYPKGLLLQTIAAERDLDRIGELDKSTQSIISRGDLKNYVFLCCSLGQVSQPEYRIKVIDVAQRGNVVEVKVSVNSPVKQEKEALASQESYFPVDVIRMDRDMFPNKGRLLFTFKNQDGNYMGEQYCDILLKSLPIQRGSRD